MTFDEATKNLQKENCFYVGSIKKAHGNKGQFSVRIFFDLEKINKESILVEINKFLVPFFIDYKKSNFDAVIQILKLFEINTIEDAKSFPGTNLFLPYSTVKNFDDYLIDWENFVVGFKLIDSKLGELGFIDNYIEDNKNPLFTIDYNNSNQLIPINSITINKTDYKKKTIYCDIPENLLDI